MGFPGTKKNRSRNANNDDNSNITQLDFIIGIYSIYQCTYSICLNYTQIQCENRIISVISNIFFFFLVNVYYQSLSVNALAHVTLLEKRKHNHNHAACQTNYLNVERKKKKFDFDALNSFFFFCSIFTSSIICVTAVVNVCYQTL